MDWKLNEPGVSLNESRFTLNGSLIDLLRKYYTGGLALGKQILKRGLGF